MSEEKRRCPYTSDYGRPRINWDALFDDWIKEGKPDDKGRFLELYGINPNMTVARRNLKLWVYRAVEIDYDAGKFTPDKSMSVVSVLDKTHAHASERIDKIEADEVQSDSDSYWNKIEAWRKKQAGEDYSTATALRQHIKLFINQTSIRNDAGEITGTKMKSSDMNHVGKCLLDIQRIQRLALGLSTENVGMAGPTEHMAIEVDKTEDHVPIFAVEINKDGKFIRPRPRQVAGAK